MTVCSTSPNTLYDLAPMVSYLLGEFMKHEVEMIYETPVSWTSKRVFDKRKVLWIF